MTAKTSSKAAMNGFKNWFALSEDAINQTIKNHFPDAPEWVRKDLFRDNWLKRQARDGGSRTPFNDWLNNPQVQAFKNVAWPQKPQCITLHPTELSERTLTDLIVRRFGLKPMAGKMFNQDQDRQKTATQCQIMSMLSSPCNHVPIIMVKEQDGKYRMIEGWHRLMCRLLDGCPEDKKQYLTNQQYALFKLWDVLEFEKWQPIQINAYIGTPKQQIQQQQNVQQTQGQADPQGQTNFFSPTAPYVPQPSFNGRN